MKLERLPYDLTICKLKSAEEIDPGREFYFLSQTGDEISLVCLTGDTPKDTIAREDGWRAFRVAGELELTLVGILADLSAVLAGQGIAIFAVSTFDTDYILVREAHYERALSALADAGYTVG